MWCIPGRGCRVNIVMNICFRAINLAGKGRECGSSGHLVGIRGGRGWCGEGGESSG